MRSFSVCLLGLLLLLRTADEGHAASKTAAVKKDGIAIPQNGPAKTTKETPSIAELRALLKQPEGFIDLAKAKVTIDHMVDPTIDVEGTLRLLDQWAEKVRVRFPPDASNKIKLDLLISTLYEPGPWNDYRPFGYDFRGPRIQALSDTFLSTYLASRKGQCVIMPIAFVLLGQKLGLPITMSMAPHHLLGKYGDEENGAWMNIEATSGKIYWDGQFEQSPLVGLSPDWAEKGAFLRPFSQKESVALFATATLAPFYKSKWQPERLLEVVDLVLAANPKDVAAMTYKADAYYQLIELRFKRKYPLAEQIPPAERKQYFFYSRENLAWYAKAESLGWKEWSKEDWAKYEAHFIKQKKQPAKREQAMSVFKTLTSALVALSLIAPGFANAGVDPVQPDPNTGANFNRYTYANNNPYKFKDPDGRQPAPHSQACGEVIYCGPKIEYVRLPNGEPPVGPFEPQKTQGELNQNGMIQRNPAIKENMQKLRSAMDRSGNKAVPMTVTGGESYVASDGRIRSITNDSVIPNRLSSSAHNVENGSRAVDLRAISMPHADFMGIVRQYTDFINNTNDYGDMHDHLGLPNRPGFSCPPTVCTRPRDLP